MTRRDFGLSAAALAVPTAGLRHLLPAATHDRFLIKASFHTPQRRAPELLLESRRLRARRVTGDRTDSDGQFWQFDVPGLRPATEYSLRLNGSEPWPLRTFAPPDATVERFRLLVYTCAGGHDRQRLEDTADPYWVSVPTRRRLLAAGLRQQPDALIAIGDHVYWDLRFGRATGRLPIGQQPWAREVMGGDFDRDLPVLGTPNEAKLKGAVDRQIADLYGTLFRSTPVHLHPGRSRLF